MKDLAKQTDNFKRIAERGLSAEFRRNLSPFILSSSVRIFQSNCEQTKRIIILKEAKDISEENECLGILGEICKGRML